MANSLGLVESAGQLRHAFGCFPSGVLAICAYAGDGPVGMAASSFTSVSLDPPLVSVCIQNTSSTWPVLRRQKVLGLSVLAEDQDAQCAALASKHGDRFAGVEWTSVKDGAVFVAGAALWLGCKVHTEVAAGDHTVVLLTVLGVRADASRAPLVFHGSRYRRLASL